MKIAFKQLANALHLSTNAAVPSASRVVLDCTAGARSLSLPVVVQQGQTVSVYAKGWATNPATFNAGPNTFVGGASSVTFGADIVSVDFIWSGTVWDIYPVVDGASAAAAVTVSDTAPFSPSPGELWFNSETFDFNIWYNDGVDAAWVKLSGLSGSAAPGANVPNFITLGGTNEAIMAAGRNLRFFNVIQSSGNLSTAFDLSNGFVTLEANKTYDMTVSAYFSAWGAGGGGYFWWVNADTNIPLITSPDRAGASLASSVSLINRTLNIIYTPGVDTRVIARTGGYSLGGIWYPEWAGTPIFRTNASYCSIKELK